jgi:hypothetical protein
MHNYFKLFQIKFQIRSVRHQRKQTPKTTKLLTMNVLLKQHCKEHYQYKHQTSNIKHQTSNINTFSFQSNDTIKIHAHHISATVTDAIKTQHGRVRVRVREASERGTCTTKQQQKQKPMSLMMLNRVLKEHNRSGVRIRIRIRIRIQ